MMLNPIKVDLEKRSIPGAGNHLVLLPESMDRVRPDQQEGF
jgi:hypothetical protein